MAYASSNSLSVRNRSKTASRSYFDRVAIAFQFCTQSGSGVSIAEHGDHAVEKGVPVVLIVHGISYWLSNTVTIAANR